MNKLNDIYDINTILTAVRNAHAWGIDHIEYNGQAIAIRNHGVIRGLHQGWSLTTDRGEDINVQDVRGDDEVDIGFIAGTIMKHWMERPDFVRMLNLSSTISRPKQETFTSVLRAIREAATTMKVNLQKENRGRFVAFRDVEISYHYADESHAGEKEFCQWSKLTPAFLKEMAKQCPNGARVNVYVGFDVYESRGDFISGNCEYDACVDSFDTTIPRKLVGVVRTFDRLKKSGHWEK